MLIRELKFRDQILSYNFVTSYLTSHQSNYLHHLALENGTRLNLRNSGILLIANLYQALLFKLKGLKFHFFSIIICEHFLLCDTVLCASRFSWCKITSRNCQQQHST